MLLASVTMAVVALAACTPPLAAGPPSPYLDVMFDDLRSTPEARPLIYGVAPPIDPTVGPNDPHRRPVNAAGNETLRAWTVDPVDNTDAKRPAIIWVHGGGFRAGINTAYRLLTDVAEPYATRGYVGISIEYRVDTTSECQWVQDHDPSTPGYAEELAQCERAIEAAQQDTQAAVRWVRRHAAAYDVDPNRIAVGGFSAGAVTAANVAYRTFDAGDRPYSRADDPAADSRVQGAFGASGCNFTPETIGAGDAPVSLIHSELDAAVDYRDCVVPTVTRARAAGLVAELTSYCDQSAHARKLYLRYQAETDEQWTTFLVRELRIYRGTRPPSADPVCP